MTEASQRRSVFRLSPDRRIADIVAAARAEIAEKGYDGISMQAIAARAGVVEGTLYRFFKTKQELMLSVAERWLEEILAEDSGLASIRGTWNQLRHLIWRTLHLLHSQPAVSRFVLIEMRPTAGYRTTRLFKLNRRFTAEVRRVCDAAIQSGEFRQDAGASLLRDMIFGCIEHHTWAFLRGEADFNVDQVADSITNVIYRGMAAVAPAPGDRMEQVVARLEAAAERIESSRGG
ncbi:MAG: TetR/AcrR family transcriptional regulator, fatty acid metabolism regulator protein [Gammaproteobacteria bacterium]|jgi:AcrR family transcriptional regulator|nr:TetR/AcrR family transcriptional regulator, fatty acid metabolism regulator protein [Gammaproteobacteria bacterium]